MYVTGVCYDCGYGTEVDAEAALSWYQQAAEGGEENAISRLTELGYYDENADQDPGSTDSDVQENSASENTASEDSGSIRNSDPSTWGDASDWNWGMTCSSENNYYPILYNKIAYAGTATYADGSSCYAGAGFKQYEMPEENFRIFLISEDNSDLYTNNSDQDIYVTLTLTNDNGNYVQSTMVMAPGTGYLEYTAADKNYGIEGLIKGAEHTFDMKFEFPDGLVVDIPVPIDEDYYKAWYYVSDRWCIPVYSDEIYTGTDVTPDLISFISDYNTAFWDILNGLASENREQSIATVASLMLNSSDYCLLEEQYENLDKYGLRDADYQYLQDYKNEIINSLGSSAANELSDSLEENGHSVLAYGLDLANELADQSGGWSSVLGSLFQ